MKKNPAIFTYRNENSLVHRIPCGIKLLVMLFVTLRTFSNSTFWLKDENLIHYIPWIRSLFYFFTGMVFFFLAKTPFKSLLRLRFLLWIAILLASLSVLSQNYSALLPDLLYTFRFFVTALFSLIVFETTSRLEIMETLCNIENKICKIIPSFKKLNFAMLISITITFIPEIFSEWNRIRTAATARSRLNKKGKPKFSINSINAQITALFLNMLQYAEEVRRAVSNRISAG